MHWMLMPLRRYAEFSGRSRRKEYWMFVLGYLIVGVIAGVLFAILSGGMDETGPGTGMTILFVIAGLALLALFIPSLAVQVRRFHDQDKSGWFVLLGFIPYIGGIIVLVFMCLPGTVGANRFGPDPKDENLSDVFA
ncbi:DUF805 domain-containing protein [Sphingomonas sp.]|jgi:uncharacterized membrane protein YhaH (DUF805 family)|uniref:DUF805 domain-containing protein n=1 Tax=Sphingomonas sp. TaxID=28214 RepID=UPI002ED9BA41